MTESGNKRKGDQKQGKTAKSVWSWEENVFSHFQTLLDLEIREKSDWKQEKW